jgi:hypothetical protein
MFSIHTYTLIDQYGNTNTVNNIIKCDTCDTDDALLEKGSASVIDERGERLQIV